MIAIWSITAAAPNDAIILNTDDLVKLFGSASEKRGRAININWMRIYLNSFSTAIDIVIYADHDIDADEEDGDATQFDFTTLLDSAVSLLDGATGTITSTTKPGSKTLFRFTAVDIAPQSKSFSLFPVFNNLVLGWSADVDFVLEMDFTVLDASMDWRSEIMDLLANKTQVEDPNLSNVDGKRQLRRAGLRIPEE